MDKKNITILLVILLAIIAMGTVILLRGNEDVWICQNGVWVRHGNPTVDMPTSGCGTNANVNANTNINQPVVAGNFEECVKAIGIIMESYPRQCRTAEGKTFTEDIGNELEKSDLIKIDNPRPNQQITSPLEIRGQARGNWFFEASFPIKLLDDDGNVLGSAIAQAEGDWMIEQFVPFTAELKFNSSIEMKGTLVLEKDNPSGLSENADELIVPVKISAQEKTNTKVYFNNSQLDPEYSCYKVFPVERNIVIEPNVRIDIYRTVMEELLKGPTDAEKAEGFFSSIPVGVKIQKLTIDGGIANADFNEVLQKGVGGSCMVTVIRSEITETLKQFPSVNEVVISIDGRIEDILQP